MAKTNEELNTLKKENEAFASKLNELSDDKLNEVSGGNRTDIQQTPEEIIPQIDDDVLLTGKSNNQGGLTPDIIKQICTYDDGIDSNGHKLYCCSDVCNRGLKLECTTCPAKNSNC